MIEKKTIAKQILLSTISANPLGSFIVRTFDQFSSITKDAQIEKKLDFLFDEIIKLKGQNIGNILINYSSNIDLQLFVAKQFLTRFKRKFF
jgi:tetrahydromethanopterin S-methyltransferase subunit G